MARIAICVSGHISEKADRYGILECLESIFNTFGCGNDLYFFLAFTYAKGMEGVVEEYISKTSAASVELNFDEVPLFKINDAQIRPETNIYNTISMFQKIWVCNKLKQDFEKKRDIIFDYECRVRPDMLFVKKLNRFNRFLILVNYYDILVPFFPWPINNLAVADFFAFGKSIAMNAYSGTFEKLNYYNDEKNLFHPESLLGLHLKTAELKVKRIKTCCYLSNADFNNNGYVNLAEL